MDLTAMPTMVDAHSHLHDPGNAGELLSTAHANFSRAAASGSLGERWNACLLCADLQGRKVDEIMSFIDKADHPGISVSGTSEPYSRVVTMDDSANPLFLVMGYQIVCKGDLEVLAYGLSRPVENGLSVTDTLRSVTRQGALGILPWGFGKWWFERGRVIENALEHRKRSMDEGGGVFVGDNGGRVAWPGTPRIIRNSILAGIWNLPGSDPLPFASQSAKAGATGSIIDCDVRAAEPLSSLQEVLNALASQPVTYGEGERFPSFVVSQIRMQLHKRFRRKGKG